METKIQLKHHAGKKAVSMNKAIYDNLKKILLNHLQTTGQSTHTEMLLAANEYYKKTKIKFEGSIEWHMEWVKLDLEARKEIKRIRSGSPVKFEIVR